MALQRPFEVALYWYFEVARNGYKPNAYKPYGYKPYWYRLYWYKKR